jgi:hypothetical protein
MADRGNVTAVYETPASGEEPASAFGFSDDFNYGLIDPRMHSVSGTTNDHTWKIVRRLRDHEDREVFWFRLDDRDYVVRDRATIDRVRKRLGPIEELGSRQGRIGAEQARIGGKQTVLGGRQARIGAQQGVLGARLARIAASAVVRGDDPDRGEQARIEREMEELSRAQSELARKHQPLALEQERLGRIQSDLGREMERVVARVAPEIRRIAEESIENRKAERLEDSDGSS